MHEVLLIRAGSPTFSTETRVRPVVSKMPKADDALFKAPTSPFFRESARDNLVSLLMLRFDIQRSSYGSTSQFRNCPADLQFIVTKGVSVSMHVLENAIMQAETDFDNGS